MKDPALDRARYTKGPKPISVTFLLPAFSLLPLPKSLLISQVEDLTRITEFSGLKKELPPGMDYVLKMTLAKVRKVWVLLKLPLAWICLSLCFLNQSHLS